MPQRSRQWFEFPRLYQDIMDYLRENPEKRFWQMQLDKRECYTVKTTFYRFCNTIRAAYDVTTPEDRTLTGLDEMYKLANNCIPSVIQHGEYFFIQVRRPTYADKFVPKTQAMRDRLKELSQELHKKQFENKAAEEDATYQKITAPPTVTCPATDLPCKKECLDRCKMSGDTVKKSVEVEN